MTEPATLIRLLADENRLRVFGAVALGAQTVAEIAARTGLDATDVQAALPRLVCSGLIAQDGGLHVSLEALQDAARRRPERARGAADATADEQRVLRNFVVDGRLVQLPARHAQKQVVLGYVARRFDESRSYEEREVNELLRDFHDDTASLRRYLVDEGLLEREAGVYRRA
ncbi:MAG TPA: DUF2087 domain-containing protein [Gaiellaceae bacterium]|jgi:hypothetical protein